MVKPGKKKVWKQNGEEDRYIIEQIKEGRITKHTKPIELSSLDLFKGYSSNVIRNHLNLMKRTHGLYCEF